MVLSNNCNRQQRRWEIVAELVVALRLVSADLGVEHNRLCDKCPLFYCHAEHRLGCVGLMDVDAALYQPLC